MEIDEEVYKIFNVSAEWKDKTTYLCVDNEDATLYYFLDTIEECIGEVRRLVIFEIQKLNKESTPAVMQSELRKAVTPERFKKAFIHFMDKADENASIKPRPKAKGDRVPYGFKDHNEFDGEKFAQRFGTGIASKSPFMNWGIVSIYYVSDSGDIFLGIEEKREYSHLKEIRVKPIMVSNVGNLRNVAVYYTAKKDNVNYDELLEKFLQVSEEVMRLGLH